MINNIIFDMGGVLVDFDVERALRTHFLPEHRQMVKENVFLSEEWRELDKGTVSIESALQKMCARLPISLHAEVKKIVLEHEKEMPPINEMYGIVKKLKENGYKIYLLSNCPSWFNEYKKSVPALSFFDGFIVSAYYNVIKPENEIYQILFKEFDLHSEECYFIDDNMPNVEAAVKNGMEAYCFFDRDIEKLKDDMRKHNINI